MCCTRDTYICILVQYTDEMYDAYYKKGEVMAWGDMINKISFWYKESICYPATHTPWKSDIINDLIFKFVYKAQRSLHAK